MAELWRGLLDLLLPRACAQCGRALETRQRSETDRDACDAVEAEECSVAESAALCTPCGADLPRLASGGCHHCQAHGTGADGLCIGCEQSPSSLSAVAAEVAYADAAAHWIQRFKYPPPGVRGLDPGPGAVVASWAVAATRRLPGEPPALWVPVAMHPRRLRERGFHPAALLARRVARALGARTERHALAALRATASQTGLARGARRRNVAGAFGATRNFSALECVGLVDDVVTTGATLEAAARALRAAGAKRVVAVCAARTPPTDGP